MQHNRSFRVEHSNEEFPSHIRKKLKEHDIEKIFIIGQGTAAVAGQALSNYLTEETTIPTESIPPLNFPDSDFHQYIKGPCDRLVNQEQPLIPIEQ